MLTAFGAAAVTFMVLMYALEPRGSGYILAFAAGCLLSSVYGFLAGTWPFGVVEAIWARWSRSGAGAWSADRSASARGQVRGQRHVLRRTALAGLIPGLPGAAVSPGVLAGPSEREQDEPGVR